MDDNMADPSIILHLVSKFRVKEGGLELTGSRKVVSYQSTLRNIPEERISHLHGGISFKSRAQESFNVRIF
jgi:hypothetical protein